MITATSKRILLSDRSPLFIFYITKHEAVSFADSSPPNQLLEAGTQSQGDLQIFLFPSPPIFYIQEIQLIFVALITIYRPTTTKLIF